MTFKKKVKSIAGRKEVHLGLQKSFLKSIQLGIKQSHHNSVLSLYIFLYVIGICEDGITKASRALSVPAESSTAVLYTLSGSIAVGSDSDVLSTDAQPISTYSAKLQLRPK